MNHKLTLLAALALGATVGAAHADTVAYTQTVAPTAASESYLGSFPQFDPALGTLTAIDLTTTTNLSGYEFIENTYYGSTYQYATGYGSIGITLPSPGIFGSSSFWLVGPIALGAFDGTQDFIGPDTGFGLGSASSTVKSSITDFTDYVGAGKAYDVLTISPETRMFDNPYIELNTNEYEVVSGAVTLTYTYTPDTVIPPLPGVPEPASWALMLVGVGALGGAVRARRRSGRLAVSAG